jgi:D-beta-D-heptose 7-phosphate kinase/D-beta-D-heptose 1-phosphate adenosyltransferase
MNKHHLVIGDLILDRFIYGNANRISAEAPSLVLDVEEEIDMLGGAYNVAAHISSLGHTCSFVTVTGTDFEYKYENFKDKFHTKCNPLILGEENRRTSVKTRLISKYKNTHLLRYDDETIRDIDEQNRLNILSYIDSKKNEIDDIIIIDYKKGVVTKDLAGVIIRFANQNNIPVYVDTKKDDLGCFEGCNIIKPNKYEFEKIKLRYAPDCEIEEACKIICDKLNIKRIVVTAGNEGIYAYDINEGLIHSEAIKVEVKELSGAGDSVLAVLSYCFSEGYSFASSVDYANKLAAKFVSSGIQYRAKKEDLFGR